jgi:hypothetical protein
MASFLVEAYTPATASIREIERRARAAAAELTRAGTPIRYVRSIFVREDEICFYVFEAAASETVREASARAGLAAGRIVEAHEGASEPVRPATRKDV